MEHSKLAEVTWTWNMKNDLLILYDETMEERYDPDGCTVNVKASLHLKWEEAGYGHYGLTPIDLLDQSFKVKYHDLVTNFDKEFPVKIEGLRKVLDGLHNEDDCIPLSDMVQCIKELDQKARQQKSSTKEIENDIRQTLNLGAGVTELNRIQLIKVLSDQLPVDTEQELLHAFELFDEEDKGYITMEEFDNIMSMHGCPLSEPDLKELKKICVIFERTDQSSKEGPAIDYQAFIKHFLKKISAKEESLGVTGYK